MSGPKSPSEIRLNQESLIIYHPTFKDRERSVIRAIFRTPDGKLSETEARVADKNSPMIRDVFLQYSEQDIENNTMREQRLQELRKEIDEQVREDKLRKQHMDSLAQAKSQALCLDFVKNCKDKELKRKIRRSESVFEITVLSSVAYMRSEPQSNT